MGYRQMEAALLTPCPSPAAHKVLIVLGFHYNHRTARCFPSHERIGEIGQMNKRTVGRALEELKEAGLIAWDKGRRRGAHNGSNHYRLLFWTEARLAAARQRRNERAFDEGVAPTKPGTSPSTLRSDVEAAARGKKQRSQKARPKRLMVDGWKAGRTARTFATDRGFTKDQVDFMELDFSLYWIGLGVPRADWNATFRRWVVKQETFDKQRAVQNDRPSANHSRPVRGNQERADDLRSVLGAGMAALEIANGRGGGVPDDPGGPEPLRIGAGSVADPGAVGSAVRK